MDPAEYLDEIDKVLLKVIDAIGEPSIHHLRMETGLHWNTIQRHGKKLCKLGFLRERTLPCRNGFRTVYSIKHKTIDISKVRPYTGRYDEYVLNSDKWNNDYDENDKDKK